MSALEILSVHVALSPIEFLVSMFLIARIFGGLDNLLYLSKNKFPIYVK